MTATLLDKVRIAENLPTLPAVAVQVLQLTHRDNVSVPQIAKVIEQDPTLTSKILKVANSSLFGLPRQICSLQQAMVVLGLRTVKVMVLTFSLVDAMQEKRRSNFDYRGFWRRCLTTAVAARLLAEQAQSCPADEVFVCALLSDIGIMAAYHADPAVYGKVLDEAHERGAALQEVERERLGYTHEVISSTMLDSWGLPASLVEAIANHHQSTAHDGDCPPENGMCKTLQAAVMIADLFCSAANAHQLMEVKQRIPQMLPLSVDDVHDLLESMQKQVQDTVTTFDLDIGATRSYKEIQAEAVVQLAKLSMAAELERAELLAREQNTRQQIEQLSTRNETLARQASTDGLTGTANRLAMEDHLARLCQMAVQQRVGVGMLLLDLDRFKKLNDTFGHQAGDTALRAVGDFLRKTANEHCLAARYGGEEFVLLLAPALAEEIRTLAEEVRLGIQQLRVPHGDRKIAITVSIGACYVPWDFHTLTNEELISRADKALYAAKQTGRNRVVFFDGSTERNRMAVPAKPHQTAALAP